jgi:hypothetical protein
MAVFIVLVKNPEFQENFAHNRKGIPQNALARLGFMVSNKYHPGAKREFRTRIIGPNQMAS